MEGRTQCGYVKVSCGSQIKLKHRSNKQSCENQSVPPPIQKQAHLVDFGGQEGGAARVGVVQHEDPPVRLLDPLRRGALPALLRSFSGSVRDDSVDQSTSYATQQTTTNTNQNAPDAEDERRLPARHLVLKPPLVKALGKQRAHPAPNPTAAAGLAPAGRRLGLLLGLVLVVRLRCVQSGARGCLCEMDGGRKQNQNDPLFYTQNIPIHPKATIRPTRPRPRTRSPYWSASAVPATTSPPTTTFSCRRVACSARTCCCWLNTWGV